MKTFFYSIANICSLALTFLISTGLYGEDDLNMPNLMIDNAATLEKIERVENGLVPAISIRGESIIKRNLLDQMKKVKVPAVSIAVINNGKVEWAKTYGVLSTSSNKKTNLHTRFQAGSVAKPVSAFAVLTFVQKGIISLDEDVNQKLISWKIPDNEFTTVQKVTLRHLLSHTSGMNVIGFDGYKHNETIPTITQTLDGIKPANNPPVRVEFIPFSKMSYSGGAYNIVQQLTEDITKLPFAQFMNNTLLMPLNMSDSTYELVKYNDSLNYASAHPTNGIPMEGEWKKYPESAAAGLWTTPIDMAKWLIEIQNTLIQDGKTHILGLNLLKDMLTPQLVVHGMGPVVNGTGDNLEVSHKGRTDGFTCGFVSFPYLKKGAIVMINAGNEASFVDDTLRSIAQEYNWPSHSTIIKNAVKLPITILEKYVGRYGWGDKPNDIYDLIIFRENEALFWKMGTASNAYRLYPETENLFFLLDTGYGVEFEEKNGVVNGLKVIVQPGFEREFKKF